MNAKTLKKIARIGLGGALIFAGVSHLTFAREEFQAQVPDWVPLKKDATVVLSGVAEIALGGSLILVDEKHEELIGKIAAAFFVAVFPGNVSQYVNRRSAFGLDTNEKRFARLFFQPVLIAWALKSTEKNFESEISTAADHPQNLSDKKIAAIHNGFTRESI